MSDQGDSSQTGKQVSLPALAAAALAAAIPLVAAQAANDKVKRGHVNIKGNEAAAKIKGAPQTAPKIGRNHIVFDTRK